MHEVVVITKQMSHGNNKCVIKRAVSKMDILIKFAPSLCNEVP